MSYIRMQSLDCGISTRKGACTMGMSDHPAGKGRNNPRRPSFPKQTRRLGPGHPDFPKTDEVNDNKDKPNG